MKLPFCEIDLATHSLCNSCQGKIDSGALSQLDVKVCEFLIKRKKDLALDGIEFDKAIEADNAIVAITSSKPGLLIGPKGKVAHELSKFLGKHVKVVGKNVDLATALSELLAPVRVKGINTVFRQQGRAFKVKLSRADEHRLPLPKSAIERVAAEVSKDPVVFEFE